MSKRENYEHKTEQLITPLIEAGNFELVDVEYVKEGSEWYLRVYIDKEGGITVEDCEQVSRAFSGILDQEDYITDPYIFEVSSPGLTRPLRKEKDFQRSLGKKIEIKLFKPVNKQKEFEGVLEAFDKDTITVVLENNEQIIFLRPDVALVRLAFV